MLVAYSDSEGEEDTDAAPPPPVAQAPPKKKQINLGQLLQRNDQELSLKEKLPSNFFDSPAEPDAGEDVDDADVAPQKGWAGLSALLPAPTARPKPSGGANSLYGRAQKLGAGGPAKKVSVPKMQDPFAKDPDKKEQGDRYRDHLVPSEPSQMQDLGGASSDRPRAGGVSAAATLRPKVDTSMYSGAGEDEPNAPYMGGGGDAETYSVAPGPHIPDWEAQQYAAAADMAGVGTSEIQEVTQEMIKRGVARNGIDATLFAQKQPDEDEVAIKAKFYNRSTGAYDTTYKASSVHKRKHQINSLAADCAANRIELEQRKSQGHKSKQQTQAKYGW